MLLTEKEAGEKWCPHARCDGGGEAASASNRSYYGPPDGDYDHSICLGSRCLQWRWTGDEGEAKCLPVGEIPDGDGWSKHGAEFPHYDLPSRIYQNWHRHVPARRGYCGLAGKPECN